ncbi:DndE family protein [Spirosoma fluviale]|uniref:DNA sulfur modification protein DndE n=1 Tax=Spirosoma fluviale TaxID=1597977 RepID=A0A286G084_9BACT|nr:DndE family protein [Spirosoma fluviale]SOD88947.1 DNA sulfur modification protein DndE [Spirosoma fluviale]
MQINIKTSEANRQRVTDLTGRIGGSTRLSENVVARIALAYSLSRGNRLNIETDVQDSKGKEYTDQILLGKNRSLYIALVCQHYQIPNTDGNLAKYIKMHLDDGLELMAKLFEQNKTYTGLDFLFEEVERGIEALEDADVPLTPVTNHNQTIRKGYFAGPLRVNIGYDIESGEQQTAMLNYIDLHSNAHIAVAGESGSGKTQFALSFLEQVTAVSGGAINFIYLDFKGMQPGDLPRRQPFFDATGAKYLDVPQTPFPFNPLSFIDNINEKNKIQGINKFVDIIMKYAARMGPVQQQQLKEATRAAFDAKKNGAYPSLVDVNEELKTITGGKPGTLSQIMDSLSELELFAPATDVKDSFLNRNYYVSLGAHLETSVRFTATFLMINYIYNTFAMMDDAPVETDSMGNPMQAIRYVFLIDEAHNIFKEPKSRALLDTMLRELRSKGVIIALVSQQIEEFIQSDMDFSANCANVFLLNIKNRNLKLMSRFLGYSEKEGLVLARSMEKIENGQAVTSLKEFKRGELVKLERFNK